MFWVPSVLQNDDKLYFCLYFRPKKKQGIQLGLFAWKNDKDKATSKS